MTKNIFVPIANTFLYCFSIVPFHQKYEWKTKSPMNFIFLWWKEKIQWIWCIIHAVWFLENRECPKDSITKLLPACIIIMYCRYVFTYLPTVHIGNFMKIFPYVVLYGNSFIQLVKKSIEKQIRKAMALNVTTFESILPSISQFLFLMMVSSGR